MKRKTVFLVLLVMFVLVVSACTRFTQPLQRPLPEEPITAQNIEVTLTVYYGERELLELIAEERVVVVQEETNILHLALEQLLLEPTNPDAIKLMPVETEVLGVDVTDEVITINFNEKIRDNFYGGSSSEALLVKSIVNTATDVPGYSEHKVSLRINGEVFESIGGHILAEDLFERQD